MPASNQIVRKAAKTPRAVKLWSLSVSIFFPLSQVISFTVVLPWPRVTHYESWSSLTWNKSTLIAFSPASLPVCSFPHWVDIWCSVKETAQEKHNINVAQSHKGEAFLLDTNPRTHLWMIHFSGHHAELGFTSCVTLATFLPSKVQFSLVRWA